MAPTTEWKKAKKIISGRYVLKNLKALDPKSLKNFQNEHGKNLLHVAAKHASLAVNKYLIEAGLEVNLKDRKKARDPLIYALVRNDIESKKIVKLLVNSGAEMSWTDVFIGRQSHLIFPNKKNIANMLCLSLAGRKGSFQAAADHLLSENWSFDNIACLHNDSILKCVLRSDHDLGKNFNKLKDAIAQQDVTQVVSLLEFVTRSKRILSWALEKALESSDIKSAIIVKLLLEKKATPHGFPGDEQTPLEIALSA